MIHNLSTSQLLKHCDLIARVVWYFTWILCGQGVLSEIAWKPKTFDQPYEKSNNLPYASAGDSIIIQWEKVMAAKMQKRTTSTHVPFFPPFFLIWLHCYFLDTTWTEPIFQIFLRRSAMRILLELSRWSNVSRNQVISSLPLLHQCVLSKSKIPCVSKQVQSLIHENTLRERERSVFSAYAEHLW